MATKLFYGAFIFHSLMTCASCISYYYMDNHCHSNVDISTDYQARIQTTAFGDYARNMDCRMTLVGDFGSRFMVYFKNLDMEYNCDNDWFRMHDGSSTSSRTIGRSKYCGSSYPSTVFTTTGNKLTLEFRSDSSIQGRGFDIVVTEFTTGYCFSYDFTCGNGRCIDQSLVCNGYNPCGDQSDCVVTVGTIVGAVIGSLCFVIFIVATIFICRRRRARLIYMRSQVQPGVATTVTSATVNTTASQGYGPPPAYDTLQYGYNTPVPNQYPSPQAPYPQQQYPTQYPTQEMRMPTATY